MRSKQSGLLVMAMAMAVAATALAGCESDAAPVARTLPSASPAASRASNGIEAQSAGTILRRARSALAEAKSFRAQGTVHQDGEKAAVDLRISGRDFIGSVSFGQAKVDLLRAGGRRYLRPNKQFWILSTNAQQGTLLAEAMGDRWVTGVDKDPTFADLFTIGSLDGLFKPEDEFDIGGVKEIAGVTSVGLMDFGDPDRKLFVAASGKPYPLQLTGQEGAELAFSDFGATVTGLAAPDAKKVIDLGKLAG